MVVKESVNHVKRREAYIAYLSGQGRPEERDSFEELLLENEEDLLIYMESLDMTWEKMPSLENPQAFAEHVMDRLTVNAMVPAAVESAGQATEEPRRSRWYEKAIFHYVIAASLTLLFLSSGVFDRLLTGDMNVVIEASVNSPSFSEQAMRAASGWLEQLMNDGK